MWQMRMSGVLVVALAACAGSQGAPPVPAATAVALGDGELEVGNGLQPAAAAAVIEAAEAQLARCDGDSAREATTLGWVVEQDGRSAMVQVESGSDAGYGGCLVAQLGRLTFPKPDGINFVDLRYRRNARPQPAARPTPPAVGVILPDLIAEALRPAQELSAACYNMRTDPSTDPAGRVVLQVRIESDGEPSAVGIVASELGEPAIERCLVTMIWNTAFPKPVGGAVEVSFPFSFQPR